MIKTSLLLFAVAATLQSQVQMKGDLAKGVSVLDSGVTLTYRTGVSFELLPDNKIAAQLKKLPIEPLGAGFGASGNTMRHFVYDRVSQSYVGYDMVVVATPDPRRFSLIFGPLTISGVMDALKAVAGDLPKNPAPLPKYPSPQFAYDGDTIALDLMVSPDGREKITDYIKLSAPSKAAPPPEPRDFSIDDGPIQIPSEPPSVLIDGKQPPSPVAMLTPSGGATFWFYFPGRGRYILSLAPHDGFAKSGTLHGTEIAFQADGRHFEIRLSSPPTAAPEAWNLYMAHDAAYRPDGMADFIVGGVDRLENLLPKRL